jgi:hypothetical protein
MKPPSDDLQIIGLKDRERKAEWPIHASGPEAQLPPLASAADGLKSQSFDPGQGSSGRLGYGASGE